MNTSAIEEEAESIYQAFVGAGTILSSSAHPEQHIPIDDPNEEDIYLLDSSSSDFHKSESTSSNLDSIDGTTSTIEKQRAVNRKKRLTRKAPNAPKRFKSAYICYVIEKMDEVKGMLSSDVKVLKIKVL